MNLTEWSNFAVATVGIAGALTGLMFVGLSLNLDFVLEHGHLPARAGTALATLLAVAILNLCVLVPHQTPHALAVEIAVLAAALLVLVLMTARATAIRRRPGDPIAWVLQPLLINLIAPILLIATAVRVATAHRIDLLPAATISGLIAAVWEAWVLLIEIRR